MSTSPRTQAWLALPAFVVMGSFQSAHAAIESLNKLKITEVVQSVNVIDATSKRQKPAQQNQMFSVPDLLSTGPNSRAEMIADDGTITRVGANTVFSFSADKREVNLQKGCVLFHSPTGKGGGTIRSAGASAAVLGTSIIVTATQDGGFKLLVLEGKAKASLANGRTVSLTAGQLTFILPGSKDFGPVFAFRLQEQVGGSNLVKGFKAPLGSLPKIQMATLTQERKIVAGKMEPTRMRLLDTKMMHEGPMDGGGPMDLLQIRGDTAVTGLSGALQTNVMASGPVDPRFLFSYPGKGLPDVLRGLMGTFIDDAKLYYPEFKFGVFAGNDITLNGEPRIQEKLQEKFGPLEKIFITARNSFTANGVNAGDAQFSAPLARMNALLGSTITDTDTHILAGRSIAINNSLLKARSYSLEFGNFYTPPPAIFLNGSTILNAGNLSGGDGFVKFQSSSFNASNSNVIARAGIDINSSAYAGGNSVEITNSGGASYYLAGYATSTSSGGISAYTPAANSSLSVYAVNDASILGSVGANVHMGAASIQIDARTINLKDVDFKAGSNVTLISGLGQLAANANTGAASVPRKTNFISGVKYNGTLLTNTPHPNITHSANNR